MSNQPNEPNRDDAMARREFLWRNSPLFPPRAQRRQPYAFYAAMRRDRPVARDEAHGLWAVYCYDDVRRVLTDYHAFSSEMRRSNDRQVAPAVRLLRGNSLLGTDPPRHRQLRDLVSRAFTPRAVASLEPRIAQITDELLDRVIGTGSMDLVRDLADPLPVTVIAEMLGIPAQERATFKRWSDDLVGESAELYDQGVAEEQTRRQNSIEAMNQYFCRIIAERRVHPRDDLISGLVQAEIEGQRLSDDDLLAFCDLLLIAGNVTTTNLLGNAVLCLLEHPDQFARLRADRRLLPSAIEETLRYESPVQAVTRVTTTDVELQGQTVPAGSPIVAFIGSANRDEAIFPDPDRFDVAREPNPHLAFGAGIHFCLGAPLARLESRVALRILFERVHDIELADTQEVEYTKGFLHGVTRLPLRFAPSQPAKSA